MSLAEFLVMAVLQVGIPGLPDSVGVTVVDGGIDIKPYNPTEFDAGPVVGNMLNVHCFPAINAYNTGRYRRAITDFTYCIKAEAYLNGNPRKAEFLSTLYYLRGMIYFYHATGIGRHILAKSDFESAIRVNPSLHIAYLELSRVYSDLGFIPQAKSIIQHLLDMQPNKEIAAEAHGELDKLGKDSK